jgi:hypothetical protein
VAVYALIKNSSYGEKRWTHTCRAKKALPVDEGPLGGEKEKQSRNMAMKIFKLKEDYSKASAKASELVRQLSFAGIFLP